MSSHVHSAKKIYLSGTPDVVAKKLCGHEHFIFLDSSGFLEHQGKPAHSILGCNPTEVMRFEVSEYEVLQQRLLFR